MPGGGDLTLSWRLLIFMSSSTETKRSAHRRKFIKVRTRSNNAIARIQKSFV